VKVSASEGFQLNPDSTTTCSWPSNKPPEPMYSGDKIIPERFAEYKAEYKRVLKLVNQESTRKCAIFAYLAGLLDDNYVNFRRNTA